jgi:hypothetical protein
MLKRAAFAASMALAAALNACPGCKDALAETPNSQGMWKGFAVTIFFMLGIVFSLVGTLVYKIVQEARKDPQPQV